MPILVALGVVALLGFAAYKGYQAVEAPSNDGGGEADDLEITVPTAPEAAVLNSTGGSADYMIPSDRSSWPAGDKVWQFAQAIAVAEGYGASETNGPTRNHNPGDISDGAGTYGHDPAITDSKVTTFPDDKTGWAWLYKKLANVFNGGSHVYTPYMTFGEFAQKYAGDSANWVRNVTNDLGVTPDTRLIDWYNA